MTNETFTFTFTKRRGYLHRTEPPVMSSQAGHQTYLKTPDGLNRDRVAMEAAEEAIKGRGDGRISIADVSRAPSQHFACTQRSLHNRPQPRCWHRMMAPPPRSRIASKRKRTPAGDPCTIDDSRGLHRTICATWCAGR
jgi:hypothetical protein